MQIIVKVAPDHRPEAERIVTRRIAETLPERDLDGLRVAPVFPGQTRGHRAHLFSVDLPAELSPDEEAHVLDALRRDPAMEYAEPPVPKSPALLPGL